MKGKTGKVFFEKADFSLSAGSASPLLPDEIKGARVLSFKIPRGESAVFGPDRASPNGAAARIFVLVGGKGQLRAAGRSHALAERAIFAPDPAGDFSILALEESLVLEIQWAVEEGESSFMEAFALRAPYIQQYSASPLYNETTKSKKTRSRSLLLQRILPRICIGSVETEGPDRVGVHAHPRIEQLFYTFPENEMDLLVDGERHHIGGDILLHIPVGSEHGAEVAPGKKLHYIWIDFVIDDEGLRYLDEAHELHDGEAKAAP